MTIIAHDSVLAAKKVRLFSSFGHLFSDRLQLSTSKFTEAIDTSFLKSADRHQPMLKKAELQAILDGRCCVSAKNGIGVYLQRYATIDESISGTVRYHHQHHSRKMCKVPLDFA